MATAQIEIQMLDLWLLGSGRGEGAHIDSTPLIDNQGLPYVPGRTVKGLLRDAALDLLQLQKGNLEEAIPKLTELFGTRTTNQNRHTTLPGRLLVTDARLPNPIAAQFIAHPHQIQGLFHDIRATAIDADTSTAKAHSLRTIRAVVPTVLTAEIESPDPADFDFITKAVCLITSLGSHRTRGLGRCVWSVNQH